MKKHAGSFALLALFAAGCATTPKGDVTDFPPLTKRDTELVERAKSIRSYPVSRAKFIGTLELKGLSSERTMEGSRRNSGFTSETWKLPEGQTVHAFHGSAMANRPVTREEIDAILMSPGNSSLNGDFIHPGKPPWVPPSKSFQSCSVISADGRAIFDSLDYLRTLEKSP